MDIRRKLTLAAAGVVALGGLSAGGAALATSGSTPPPAPVVNAPAATTVPVSVPDVGAKAAPDTDNVQQGDQGGPDNAKSDQPEAADHESGAADAHDDPNGHADPPGDVQHDGGANER